jgi:C-terminal processing protease CtpA/Prc
MMRMAAAIVLLVCLSRGVLNGQVLTAVSPDEGQAWRDDLRFMTAEMERNHKNLYHSISREEFGRRVAALDARIPSLARHQIIVAMAQLVASVGDGHTNIYPTRDTSAAFHSLPVSFTYFGDELRIRAAHQSQRALVGGRVLRIGERDVTDAYARVRTMIGHDNEQGVRYWAQHLLAIPEVLHALGITNTVEDVALTIANDQRVETVVLHPFGPVEIMTGDTATLFNRREGWIDARDLNGRSDPAWLRRTNEVFHFEHLGPLLYVQISQVLDSPSETLEQFSRRLRAEIQSTKPAKVALDVRLNRGGNGTLTVPLIRAIVQSSDIDRTGHLFAIIGNATFSAAQMLVDELEKYTNVTFVGEPTGSKGNVYSDSRRIVLPGSGLTVRVSIYYWQYWHPADMRTATEPDIAAPMTFEAYLANEDPALLAIERQP